MSVNEGTSLVLQKRHKVFSSSGIFELLASWRFGLFLLSSLATLCVFLVLILFLPQSGNTTLGTFAEDFMRYCFRFDPQTGELILSSVFMFFSGPLIISIAIFFVWGREFNHLIKTTPRAFISPALLGTLVVAVASYSLVLDYKAGQTAAIPPFPGESIRTSIPAPNFSLKNQEGKEVSLEMFRGNIVLLTAFYRTCPHTCPTIISSIKQIATQFPQSNFAILAVTLDPKNDTVEALGKFSRSNNLLTPKTHLLTGEKEKVDRVLDSFDISRDMIPQTDIIGHSNLFVIIDETGNIAYRFALGDTQQSWLRSALSQLILEK